MKRTFQCISQNICNTAIKLVVSICNRVGNRDGKRYLRRPKGFNLVLIIIILGVFFNCYYRIGSIYF